MSLVYIAPAAGTIVSGCVDVPSPVLPGKYRLFIGVGQGYLGSGLDSRPSTPSDPRIASAATKITVPAVSGEDVSPLDIGDIILAANH